MARRNPKSRESDARQSQRCTRAPCAGARRGRCPADGLYISICLHVYYIYIHMYVCTYISVDVHIYKCTYRHVYRYTSAAPSGLAPSSAVADYSEPQPQWARAHSTPTLTAFEHVNFSKHGSGKADRPCAGARRGRCPANATPSGRARRRPVPGPPASAPTAPSPRLPGIDGSVCLDGSV